MFFQNQKQDPATVGLHSPNSAPGEANLSPQELAKAQQIIRTVTERAARDGLTLTPAIYAVLYAHADDTHPDLSRRIHTLEAEGHVLTNAVCQTMYDAYLSRNQDAAIVQEASQKLQTMLIDIASLIANSGVAQREYQQRLIKKSDRLSDHVGEGASADPVELKTMVQALIEDTKRMLADNQKLEIKLNNSAVEMQDMRETMQNLKREAMTDSLTGLANRKSFDLELKSRASEVMETGKSLSILMIDIDKFKQFNDTYGHQVGDQVLKLVSNALQSNVRPHEMVSRFGGEEFTVLLPGSKLREAEKIAEKLREKIALKDIVNQVKQENMGRLSVSIGVAQLKPGESVSLFIERSDRALYKAKELGRNKVVAMEYDAALHKDMIGGDIVIDVNR